MLLPALILLVAHLLATDLYEIRFPRLVTSFTLVIPTDLSTGLSKRVLFLVAIQLLNIETFLRH